MFYRIAEHNIEIVAPADVLADLLPSFLPFLLEGKADNLLFRLTIDENLQKVAEDEKRLIRDVDTGNGRTCVEKTSAGGYQFTVRDIYGRACALLVTSPRFDDCRVRIRGGIGTKRFALNNALMLVFAFSGAYFDTLLIHASVVRHKDKAYAFTAKSGTGKSTQVANWMRYIEGCDIMNDDNPIIRIIDGKPVLYGSPWSGKTPCYRNTKADLGAIILIERDTRNHVEPMQPLIAFSTILSACSGMKWDETLYQLICKTSSAIVEKVKVVALHCLPDRESAEVCRAYMED